MDLHSLFQPACPAEYNILTEELNLHFCQSVFPNVLSGKKCSNIRSKWCLTFPPVSPHGCPSLWQGLIKKCAAYFLCVNVEWSLFCFVHPRFSFTFWANRWAMSLGLSLGIDNPSSWGEQHTWKNIQSLLAERLLFLRCSCCWISVTNWMYPSSTRFTPFACFSLKRLFGEMICGLHVLSKQQRSIRRKSPIEDTAGGGTLPLHEVIVLTKYCK